MENIGKLLTVKEAATMTSLSKSMVYKLLDERVLRRVRLPGCSKVLISEAELRRFVEAGVRAGCELASA
ncbi:MAG: helix-turn-helix domain-containing protein [Gemmataceae bacterium]